MPLQPIPKKPVGLSEIPRLPQCISQGDEASPVRIRLRPIQILQLSDVDFLGLSHRSILDDAGERAEEGDDQLVRR